MKSVQSHYGMIKYLQDILHHQSFVGESTLVDGLNGKIVIMSVRGTQVEYKQFTVLHLCALCTFFIFSQPKNTRDALHSRTINISFVWYHS